MFASGARQRARTARQETFDALAFLVRGEHAIISEIPDARARAQAVRFGMGAGAPVQCVSTLPGGPIIVRSGRQEIAIGRGLARRIRIERAQGATRECA